MKKFLIINPFGIGDVLFTTAVIKAIKENNPDNFIGYWCNERVRDIFSGNPHVDKIFALSRGDIKKIAQKSKLKGVSKFLGLLRQIRREKFDIALDFSLDHRYALPCKISGIKRRIGFNYKGRGRLLTDRIDLIGYSQKHVVEYYLDLLAPLNIIPKSKELELFVSDKSNSKAKEIFSQSGISDKDLVLGIAAGAGLSWGKDASLKHWLPERFAQLADKVIEEFGAKVLLLGDGSEMAISEKIISTMKHKALNLAGKTSLESLAGIIAKLKILVTNDGGPLHMACALGIKTVSIFGPVDDKVYGPYPPSDKHIVVKSNFDCQPCYQQFRMPDCERNRQCISSIDVGQVLTAVRRIL